MSANCGLNDTTPKMSKNLQKTDPRIQRTRDLIRRAMESLTAEVDFRDITIQRISERAGINRATFYDHFDDKYALMNYVAQQQFQELLEQKLPPAPAFTRENLRCLVLATCEYLDGFVSHCAPSRHDESSMMMMMQAQNCISDVILKWVAGSSRHSVPELVTMASSWAIFGTVHQWAHNKSERRISAAQLTDQLLTVLIDGLGAYLPDTVSA